MKTGSASTSSSEGDLEVTLDWEEIPVSKAGDDWTEARKKQNKKVLSTSTERKSRRALAGTVPEGNASGNGSGKRERKGKRGGRKRDNGVRDMKPRPCHTYYLSECLLLPYTVSIGSVTEISRPSR